MNPIDIVILVFAVGIVVGVVVWSGIRKKQGKSLGCDCASSCGGNCQNCPSCQGKKKEEQ